MLEAICQQNTQPSALGLRVADMRLSETLGWLVACPDPVDIVGPIDGTQEGVLNILTSYKGLGI